MRAEHLDLVDRPQVSTRAIPYEKQARFVSRYSLKREMTGSKWQLRPEF
jgi:hypothetical protein